ncbi:hypothetical protein LZ32DRAFT_197174 [Colletotrichum eremochloae]|nr:hypothetical protein LZ32DRAFT_197174 [Colletotrichum eremochloae]
MTQSYEASTRKRVHFWQTSNCTPSKTTPRASMHRVCLRSPPLISTNIRVSPLRRIQREKVFTPSFRLASIARESESKGGNRSRAKQRCAKHSSVIAKTVQSSAPGPSSFPDSTYHGGSSYSLSRFGGL